MVRRTTCLVLCVCGFLFSACLVDISPVSRDAQSPDGAPDVGVDADVDAGSTCGDGVIEAGEACDGTALGGETCHSQGRDTGVLACQDCQFDYSGCGPLVYGSGADGYAFVPGVVNLSESSLVPTRTCEDAAAYAVVDLGDTWAEVDGVIANDCLAAEDQVLLINLQGANSSQTQNVGNGEILEVLDVTGDRVTFTTPKQNPYGNNGGDTNIGTAAGMQRVVVQRVPQYESLDVQGSGLLTVNPYDCVSHTGGVLAIKVRGSANIDGEVDVSELGYQGGQRLNDQNGAQGDSYGGDCISTNDFNEVANLGGGGGGICDLVSTGCAAEDGCAGGGGGGGHLSNGENGRMNAWRGFGGAAYGTQFPDQIFFGSGGGAGAECVGVGTAGSGGRGGGIIIMLAAQVGGAGALRADGQPGILGTAGAGGGGGGSGGSIYVRGGSIQASFANNASASGGSGGNGDYNGGTASEGRMIFIE